jgi:hypothetical protein
MPDRTVQQRFLAALTVVEKAVATEEKHCQQSRKLFNSLLQRAFHGEL